MKKNTRFAFNAYLQQLARLNGVAVEELSSKFTVEPSVQQTLEDQIQQSAAFLTLINVTPVTEQSGQLLGLGVGSTIAGTTDTTAKEREPVDPTLMVDVEYKCEQTNFDTVLTYAKLDLWAKFQDFQVRIRDAIVKRQALDRIMIGFNGVKRAEKPQPKGKTPPAGWGFFSTPRHGGLRPGGGFCRLPPFKAGTIGAAGWGF